MKYPVLFEPLRLGKIELRNRVVMPPMTTGFARNGYVTDTMIDYYAARAEGGTGLVIVEDSIVETPRGKHGYNDIYVDDDKFIPDLGRLARVIKNNGAAAAIQLNFSGRMAGKLRDGRLMSVLERLRREERIGAIGVSCDDFEIALAAASPSQRCLMPGADTGALSPRRPRMHRHQRCCRGYGLQIPLMGSRRLLRICTRAPAPPPGGAPPASPG